MRKILLFLTVLFALVFLTGKTFAQTTASSLDNSERVIVKFRSLVPRVVRQRLAESHGGVLSERLRLPETQIMIVPKERSSELISRLQRNWLVEYVEPDYIALATELPDDPYFSDQWGLNTIEGQGAWDVTHGANDVDIAIIDTGIDGNHPDLGSKVVASVNCIIDSSCPSVSAVDENGHGSHVAGIASAVTNNSVGVAGTSWEGRLISVKVLDDEGSGYYSWVANGIYWATDNGAEVINLSLGGRSSSTTLKNAINYAWDNGVVVVAAAGNNGSKRSFYPASYRKVIAVAATDKNDQKAYFSNYGRWVDVAAPGVSILSTYKGNYSYSSGTSMAAPYVSGLAALLIGQHPTWNNGQIRNQIESTSDNISGTGFYWTHGRINACRAVGCGVSPSPTPIETSTPSPTPTMTMTPSPTPTVTPTPSATPSPKKPWWCRWRPQRRYCQ